MGGDVEDSDDDGGGRSSPGLPPGLAQLFEIVLNTAAANRSLDRSDLEIFRRAGAEAARQGLRLATVIDSYLRGAGELWEQVLAEPDPRDRLPVLERGRMLRRVSEDAVAALATGYEDAQRRTIRAEEAARREFIDDLLSGEVEPDALRERARRLDVPLSDTSVVAVARGEDPSGAAEVAHERAERVVRSRLGGTRPVVATHHGLLVVVVPADDAERLSRLATVLRSSDGIPWVVAIGRPYTGPGGAARSFADARRTLDLAGRAGWSQPVVRWEEMLPYRILAADGDSARELVESVIRPLVEAPRGSLLPTVAAHIECGGNMAEMARVLSLSPRAIAYRLERIQAVTGRSLRNADDRFVLELAARCHRLLGDRDGSRW